MENPVDITPPAQERFAGLCADVAVAGDTDLNARFRELELQRRRLTAEMAVLAGEVERRGSFRDDGHRSLAGWLRAHGNYSGATVAQLRRLARFVSHHGPAGDELLSGRIGVDQAAELARAASNPRCGDQIPAALDGLLEFAHRLRFDDFRTCVRRWEILADLDGAHRDRGDAVAARRAAVVVTSNGVDVSASGGTAMQAAEMEAILASFTDAEFRRDCAAGRDPSDTDTATDTTLDATIDTMGRDLPRTDAQRRFDAFLTIFRTANSSPHDGTPTTATVSVLVDQHTFESALARHHLADEPTDLVPPSAAAARCETSTGVPLFPDDVVFAALGGWVRRVVIDSAGVVTDLGRRRRCFTGAAEDAARLLVTSCEQPGCSLPADWSQVDHLREWHDHGRTDQRNSGIRCGHHNRHKHRHGFRARRDMWGQLQIQRPDGTWIVPVGVDPPTDDDFVTDEEMAGRIRQRLRTEQHAAAAAILEPPARRTRPLPDPTPGATTPPHTAARGQATAAPDRRQLPPDTKRNREVTAEHHT